MPTPQRGTIVTWKEDKGFGFITPADGGNDVFVHASSLPPSQKRPAINATVTYTLAYDNQQRPRAINVQFDHESIADLILPTIVVGVFFIGLGLATVGLRISPLIFPFYLILSIITFFVYGIDKANATQGRRRIAEKNLHLLELLGGWPGALVAQWYHHHKNRKQSYRVVYWLMVVLNLTVLVLYGVYR